MKTKLLAIVATCLLSLSAFALTGAAAQSGADSSCQGQSSCCHHCCSHK